MSKRQPTTTTALGRRALLLGGGAAALAATARGASAASPPRATCDPATGAPRLTVAGNLPPERIGAQLYSVSDQVTEIGYRGVLRALAEIGYSNVEFAGFNASDRDGLTPAQIRKAVAGNGLTAVGNHGSTSDADIRFAAEIGAEYTGLSILTTEIQGNTTDSWKRTADILNNAGRRSRAAGLRGFYVHMHGPEYLRVGDDPQRHVIDVLLEHTDPATVFFEMDLYWAYFFTGYLDVGGALADPLQWVLPQPQRFPLFHVKDGVQMVRETVGDQTVQLAGPPTAPYPLQAGIVDVGQGSVDFKHFFSRLAQVSDLRKHYFLWERDTAGNHPKGSLCSARASFEMIARGRLADARTAY